MSILKPVAQKRPCAIAWRGALIVASLHLMVALIYHYVVGVDVRHHDDLYWNTWDWCWEHLIPSDLLLNDLWPSLLYMHSQPPLFNLYGAILMRVFGLDGLLEAQNLLNIAAGTVMSALTFGMAFSLTRRRAFLWFWALLLSLNPTLFVYEAYPFYTFPTAFWVMMALGFALWWQLSRSNTALIGLIFALNMMVLIRSLYHGILIILGLLWIALACNKRRLATLVICVVLCLPTFAVYAKNYVLYGFVGDSSWSGFGLWRAVSRYYSDQELLSLAHAGVIDEMVATHVAWDAPASAYQLYGFDDTSDIPLLAGDGPNNINVPAIAKVYKANAPRLVRHDARRYVLSVSQSFAVFCRPSTMFKHTYVNADRILYHDRFYSYILQGMVWPLGSDGYGLYLLVLLPVALTLYPVVALVDLARSQWALRRWLNDNALLAWMYCLIAYTVAVSCGAGYMEQQRFKVLVETPIWLFVPSVLGRAWTELRGWRGHRNA